MRVRVKCELSKNWRRGDRGMAQSEVLTTLLALFVILVLEVGTDRWPGLTTRKPV